MDVLLAPHQDDETLFAAYACLEHKPLVICVLRSFVEASWPDGPTWETREAEQRAACQILGVDLVQWEFRDDPPPWDLIEREIIALRTESVFAPLPEPGGHPHHNEIGTMAVQRFKHVKLYSTYTHEFGKTTTGTLVVPEPGMEEVKREAMACYRSQIEHPYTAPAWEWPIDEYLT